MSSQSSVQNKLLQKLTSADFDVVFPLLERVDLALKQQILRKGDVIEWVYFPEDCVCSLLAQTECVNAIEVGMYGFEGMSNLVIRTAT